MGYCTVQDLIDRFGETEIIELTDRRGLFGAVDTTVAQRAIDDATAEVDGYVAGRYQVPLQIVPVVIERICADLARFHLYDNAPPEHVEKRHTEAVRLLRAISRGEVQLGVDDTGDTATGADGAEMQSGGRVFGRDGGGFIR